MDQSEVGELLGQELGKQVRAPQLSAGSQLPVLHSQPRDKRELANLNGMISDGRSTVAAMGVIVGATSYAQGEIEAGATIMVHRLTSVERMDVLQSFLTRVTGNLMLRMEAGVLAIIETLPERLGERL